MAAELGAAIEIDVAALAAEGITQNQTLELELRDAPAADVLVAILRQANPDRAAENAADPRQKLVYVVEGAGDGPGRIIVTTRAAAAAGSRPLPAVFVGPDG